MLCPDCKRAVPGGAICPQCKHPVPERESFSGQGGHYLRVFLALSLFFVVVFVLPPSIRSGFGPTIRRLYETGWIWLYLVIFLITIGVGLYYWSVLHEEEITITDEYIARRSHWGDEYLAWADVHAFQREPKPFRETRLGRISGISRVFAEHKILLDLPPISYTLIGPPDPDGNPICMCLEPGTIDDMPWLLQIIEERIGPPVED